VNLPSELLDEVVRGLASELAPLVAAELRPAMPTEGESWYLLDLDKAAARLGRSTRWVRDRVKAGDLPYVRLDGGAFAFELADLQAFARARRVALEEPEALADRLQAAREPASANGFGNGHRVTNRRVAR